MPVLSIYPVGDCQCLDTKATNFPPQSRQHPLQSRGTIALPSSDPHGKCQHARIKLKIETTVYSMRSYGLDVRYLIVSYNVYFTGVHLTSRSNRKALIALPSSNPHGRRPNTNPSTMVCRTRLSSLFPSSFCFVIHTLCAFIPQYPHLLSIPCTFLIWNLDITLFALIVHILYETMHPSMMKIITFPSQVCA